MGCTVFEKVRILKSQAKMDSQILHVLGSEDLVSKVYLE